MKQYLTEKRIVYVIKSIAQLVVNLSLMIMSAITCCVYFAVVVMLFTCNFFNELIKDIKKCLA